MTLTEMYSRPMKEVLEECEIIEQKIHTNPKGEVQAIELKYVPKAELHADGAKKGKDFGSTTISSPNYRGTF